MTRAKAIAYLTRRKPTSVRMLTKYTREIVAWARRNKLKVNYEGLYSICLIARTLVIKIPRTKLRGEWRSRDWKSIAKGIEVDISTRKVLLLDKRMSKHIPATVYVGVYSLQERAIIDRSRYGDDRGWVYEDEYVDRATRRLLALCNAYRIWDVHCDNIGYRRSDGTPLVLDLGSEQRAEGWGA